MAQSQRGDYDQGDEVLRPVEDLFDPTVFPKLAEEYHSLAEKDIHLAELYRLAMTSQGDQMNHNPVQAVRTKQGLLVDVLAEIGAGAALKQLQEIMQVHNYTQRFVSGQILAQHLPELNQLVTRMQASRPVRPAIDTSIAAIQADRPSLSQALPGNNPPPTGKDVIVGVVDFGCDFVHPNFLDQNKQTRLLFLWDQRCGPGQSNRVPYGRAFNQQEIEQANQASNKNDSYNALSYKPEDGEHGTHVMDIAAGSSPKYPGVAPQADLIFVHLGLPEPIEVEKGFLGSTKWLCDAVKYIFDQADALDKPAVVNISLGSHGGAHDGTSLSEGWFDDLLSEKNGRAIVIAAGNSFAAGCHAMGTVAAGAPVELEWHIQNHATVSWDQRQEMEIWYESLADLEIEIFAPNGQRIGSCPMGATRQSKPADAAEPIMLVTHNFDPAANEKHINVFIDDRYPNLLTGVYRFRLSLAQAQPAEQVGFHAWIERNDAFQSVFTSQSSNTDFTINSIGNAGLPVVVGAYDTDNNDLPIAPFSSAGPSRNQAAARKPDISAPGVNIFAARALHHGLEDGIVKRGTSAAAPHVTGLIALLFQAASELRNPPLELGMDQIRQILIESAEQTPPEAGANGHDPRYGFGRVNGANALQILLS